MIEILYKYKTAFKTDKDPLGFIIEHEGNIIINLDKPYQSLIKRPAYPARPRARDSLEVHIEELMELGALKKVDPKQQLEVTKPVIITWHNGKSRIVGNFRALSSYTIPNRYPIPGMNETLTQV
ncbi:hypothetical protein O181_075094 [Austropuccinia psidii MF-1]|uniref:Uncharacterized protein n=1 Tax=Austropuccinia psidii MF-1 TaxID=1389203 RepID=A0A9Q3F9V5_9BASI|nr:hypothetical protein [Austropuccinia psidii MF-1]